MTEKTWLVKLESGVWLADGLGDPPRTLARDNARRFIPRLDRSELPPGYNVFEDEGEWYWSGDTTTESALGEDAALAAAWAHYKARHDPPGAGLCEPLGAFTTREEWRAAAWAWYERRLALAERLEDALRGSLGEVVYQPPGWSPIVLMSLLPVWPRCLAWSDEQVAAVERWLAEGGEVPEVLRG